MFIFLEHFQNLPNSLAHCTLRWDSGLGYWISTGCDLDTGRIDMKKLERLLPASRHRCLCNARAMRTKLVALGSADASGCVWYAFDPCSGISNETPGAVSGRVKHAKHRQNRFQWD